MQVQESQAPVRVKGLGNVMRRARKAARLSRAELSTKVGRSPGVIRAAERGHITVTQRYLARVLEACGTDLDFDAGEGAVCVAPYDTVRPSSKAIKAAKPT